MGSYFFAKFTTILMRRGVNRKETLWLKKWSTKTYIFIYGKDLI